MNGICLSGLWWQNAVVFLKADFGYPRYGIEIFRLGVCVCLLDPQCGIFSNLLSSYYWKDRGVGLHLHIPLVMEIPGSLFSVVFSDCSVLPDSSDTLRIAHLCFFLCIVLK